MLYRLVYMSSAADRFVSSGLDDILRRSRRNNGRDGVSGLLIYHDGNFLQILEGDEDRVLSCYRRIISDSRHTGCMLLKSEEVSERVFEGWNLACLPFAELASTCQSGFIDLQNLRHSKKMEGLAQDKMVQVLLDTFLGSFRDSRLT